MRPLHSCPLLVLAFALLAPNLAHADLVVPAEANCRGKKVGDACNGGTCQSDGFECQAGACRRFGDESECTKNGCSWVESLRCVDAPATPTPAPTPTPTPTTTAPASAVPSSPGSCAGSPAGATAALLALTLWRRRRR